MDRAQRALRAYAYENPRPEVAALVPPDARRILDLGCASGALGAALKERGAIEVVGVEREPDYARDAAARLDHVVAADLEALAADQPALEALGRFDCLVAADVLEHLVDPWTVLHRFAELLDAGASAVVSLPNVRHWETFWQLGRHGTWPRRNEGIFDRTHLRWFTLADAHALLVGAGLEPVSVVRRFRVRRSPSRWDATAVRLVPRVPAVRTLLTFQHLILARRRSAR